MKPLHPCGVSSCPTLVRTPRCKEHTITREQRNPRSPEQIRFYGSIQWKAIRARVCREQPICTMCHHAPTTTVHHVDGNWRNNLPDNHAGACDPCHRSHSGSEHYKKRTA